MFKEAILFNVLYNESIEQNLGGFFPDKTSETIVMHKMTTDQASCEYMLISKTKGGGAETGAF